MLRAGEKLRRGFDKMRRRQHGVGRPKPLHLGKRRQGADLRLLQRCVEVDVSRAARRGIGDLRRTKESLVRGRHRRGLVVPFSVVADERALVRRRVDPVDPGTPLGGVPRPGRTQDQHRHAVAPGVENRHARVHEADVRMHHRPHHPAGRLGVALRDRHGGFLVQAQQHLRARIAEVVDDAVVQAAVARAGVEREVGDIEGAQHRGDRVAAPDLLLLGAGERRLGAHARREGLLGVHVGLTALGG